MASTTPRVTKITRVVDMLKKLSKSSRDAQTSLLDALSDEAISELRSLKVSTPAKRGKGKSAAAAAKKKKEQAAEQEKADVKKDASSSAAFAVFYATIKAQVDDVRDFNGGFVSVVARSSSVKLEADMTLEEVVRRGKCIIRTCNNASINTIQQYLLQGRFWQSLSKWYKDNHKNGTLFHCCLAFCLLFCMCAHCSLLCLSLSRPLHSAGVTWAMLVNKIQPGHTPKSISWIDRLRQLSRVAAAYPRLKFVSCAITTLMNFLPSFCQLLAKVKDERAFWSSLGRNTPELFFQPVVGDEPEETVETDMKKNEDLVMVRSQVPEFDFDEFHRHVFEQPDFVREACEDDEEEIKLQEEAMRLCDAASEANEHYSRVSMCPEGEEEEEEEAGEDSVEEA